MANLEQASTSVTYADKATVYDSNGSAEYENNVIHTDSSMDPGGGEVEQLLATIKEIRALYESLYNNLVIKVEKVNTVLYNGKALLDKHDPTVVYDSQETLQLAQERRLKMKQLDKEIKPSNYAKINKNLEVFVSQMTKSQGEEFLKEAAKFVRHFKSITKETDESIEKIKVLEIENERLFRAIVSQDMISIVQSHFVVDTSILQIGLERDLKGKSMNTQCASNTLDSLSQKHDDDNVSLEFQVLSLEKENEHLKLVYQIHFDSIKQTRAETKFKTDS
ncbi:hypothetical protein Tco_1126686 [Tanacetum coccineum]